LYGCCWVGLLGMDIRTHTLHLIRFVSFFFVDYGHLWYYYGSSHSLFSDACTIFNFIFFTFFPPEACVSSNDFLFFVLRI